MKIQFINHNIFVLTLVIVLIVFGMEEMSYGQDLNVGEPRTVRMIYFLPNDLPYRADVVQNMKDMILTVQNFYAEQMEAHGYGNKTFQYETDDQDNPMVHRVDGQHPFSHYDNTLGTAVIKELEQAYDLEANIYFIVLGAEALRQGNGVPAGGVASQLGKNGGHLVVPNEFSRFTVGHELGHTFGLGHDFRDNSYIMSYGNRQNSSLSACAAEFLAVSPHLNPRIPIAETSPPTIELISSPTYPVGSKSIPVRLKIKDSDGIHQVQLHARGELQECRGLAGKQEAVVEFEYDGGIGLSDATVHNILIKATDADGNVGTAYFTLAEMSPLFITDLRGRHTDAVQSLAFSPDGQIIASGSIDNTVKLWNVATETNIDTFKHTRPVNTVKFSSDGQTLASGGDDGIHLWDMTTRKITTMLDHGVTYYSVSFSPDGQTLASTSSRWSDLQLWDLTTERSIDMQIHEGNRPDYPRSVSFSPNGQILATGSWYGEVKLWDVATKRNIATLDTGAGKDSIYAYPVRSMSFSPDGQLLATGGSGDRHGKVELWDVAAKRNIATLKTDWAVFSMSFSPDGQILAIAEKIASIELWDIATASEIVALPHTSPVYSVAFSPNGTTLASGTSDGTIKLWDVPLSLLKDKDVVVSIPDPNLAAEVRKNLGVPLGVAITRFDMRKLKVAHFTYSQITDLTGLEHAINLRDLTLSHQQIRDITPLAELSKLDRLHLTGNKINNIAPLAGLTNLEYLGTSGNQINDIRPIAGLTNLRHLSISNNKINDITPFAALTNLEFLNIEHNQINDITLLAGLTNLEYLRTAYNQINDITPLTGLTNLQNLDISHNPISDISLITKFTRLRALSLGGIPIKDTTIFTELTELKFLQLINCQISELGQIARLTQLEHLFLQHNQIIDVSPLTNLLNLRSLYLQGNPIKSREPLFTLLRKNPDIKIYLKDNTPLPVTLSYFRAEHMQAGVILNWTTESEVDNAGFYIYRSETKDGVFKVVNPTLIQGAGTTGERNTYTWTDTTAKPNTVYYYRIEDVSHAGVREQLATVRLRGLVSAIGKLTTRWADLKSQE